jgi:UDP-N-acetylmuramate: L-alanyl-gamma-D-glutamyl-meso-diaminopimelate ligase
LLIACQKLKRVPHLPDADSIVAHVAKNVQGGDIVVMFSNGGFGGIHAKLLERLDRRQAPPPAYPAK